MANDVFEIRWRMVARAGARAQLLLHFETNHSAGPAFQDGGYVASIVHNELREFLGEYLPRRWLMRQILCRRINNGGGPTFTNHFETPSNPFNDGFTRFALGALLKADFRCAGKWLTKRLWLPGVMDTVTRFNGFHEDQLFKARLFAARLLGLYTFGPVAGHFVGWSRTYQAAAAFSSIYVHANPRPLESRGRTKLVRL